MPTYTVRVNGSAVVSTDSPPRLFSYIHDLRNAAGPVTVEEGGREMSALEVEEIMLAYHAGKERAAETQQEREHREGNEEAGPFNLTAAYGYQRDTPESLLAEAYELEDRANRKERQARASWCKSSETLRRDAEIFREEAASKRRRAARLAGVASY